MLPESDDSAPHPSHRRERSPDAEVAQRANVVANEPKASVPDPANAASEKEASAPQVNESSNQAGTNSTVPDAPPKPKKQKKPRTNWQELGLVELLQSHMAGWNASGDDTQRRKAFLDKVVAEIAASGKWKPKNPTNLRAVTRTWFKNHKNDTHDSGSESEDDVPDNDNATQKSIFSKRAKGPSERWAEVPENKARILQYMDPTKGAGQGGRIAAMRKRLYDELPQEEKDYWESLPPPEQTPDEVEADMAENRKKLPDTLSEMLRSLIGVGPHRIGNTIFFVRWAIMPADGELDTMQFYVGDEPDGESFIDYAGGLMAENTQWVGYSQKALRVGHGITYVNGRPMLPESRPEWNGINMIEVLQEYFRAAWHYAHQGVDEVPVLTAASISERLAHLGWPTPDLSQATGATVEQVFPLWIKIRSTQDTDAAFTFAPKDAVNLSDEVMIASVNAARDPVNPANNTRRNADGRSITRRASRARVVESTDDEKDDDEGMDSTSVRLSRAASRIDGISEPDDETTSGAAADVDAGGDDKVMDDTAGGEVADEGSARNGAGSKGKDGPARRAKQKNNQEDENAEPRKKRKMKGGDDGKAKGTQEVADEPRQPRVRKPSSKAAEAAATGISTTRSSAGSSRATRPKSNTTATSKSTARKAVQRS
ncbi:uncharacterized protein C8Q71DRAFT_862754 [Rhodofomes roseus]|uniref:Uncharacterized protein n=1 Tax=Rhodofomes roseus TaxID=34475 RepID=A0ABQ8K0K6_9APHY|nr:uncharacterized protein C8Q71DRAFT_862754 [Rhodofomes roseus]KAH9830171.1 hypothetical protein C8Q71DRAFT_862754 [Rhodofomes roseus]